MTEKRRCPKCGIVVGNIKMIDDKPLPYKKFYPTKALSIKGNNYICKRCENMTPKDNKEKI